MTVASGLKSPGQKMKTPKKQAPTPNKKTPKGSATPNGTPKAKTPSFVKGRTPKNAPSPAGSPKVTPIGKATPKAKTPKAGVTPKAVATPKSQPLNKKGPANPHTPKPNEVAGQKTPKALGNNTPKGKTPKGVASPKTPKPNPHESPAKSKSPKASPRKRSASTAGLDNASDDPQAGFKTVRVYNLPAHPQADLLQKVRELLEPRGEIDKIKYFAATNSISVVFKNAEDARAAKKLSGVLLGGRHLTMVHSDDRDLPVDNRVCISNTPTDLDDEDIWSLFGSCGKILSIHMNRDWRTKKVQRCFVTFDNKKAVDTALSSQKTCRGKQLIIKKAGKDGKMFPIESTVYLLNISTDTSENEVQQFLSKCGPISGVNIVESKKRYAMVHMTNEADVGKALNLSNKELKGKKIQVERHRKSALYVNPLKDQKSKNSPAQSSSAKEEVPSKKLKQNSGAALAKVKQEVKEEVDDDDEEEDDDDEEEDDDDEEEEDDDESEGDLLAAFQGKMQNLKSKVGDKEEDEGDSDEDDDEDDDDDDEEEDDDDEEEDDDEDDDDDDEDDDDDDDDDE